MAAQTMEYAANPGTVYIQIPEQNHQVVKGPKDRRFFT